MIFRVLLALAALTLGGSTILLAQQPDAAPVDPDATPEARALLKEIDAVSGHGILSGQHNFPSTVSRYSDRILELTGSYPAIFGQDFGFSGGEDKDSTLGRPSMIEEVIRQYHRGAVIALCWHAVRPTEDEPVTFHDSVQGHLTDWEWQQLITPGTDLHARWERQVDRIAGYLRELQDAGVPVLFRPYHEMNGNWFWWGGRPGPKGTQELYRQLYDRYVHVLGLHNLVWVWNVNAPSVNAGPVDQYFPGDAYADVEAIDIYGPFEQSYYTSMLALAGTHKPIALAEVGTMPTLDVLAQQPRWAYFMMWSGMAEGSNTPEQLQTMFHSPDVWDRGDKRLPAPPPATSRTPLPVDPQATPATRALLASLATPGPGGQGGDSTRFTLLDLASAQNTRDTLKQLQSAGQVPLLRWTPASPTGTPGPLDDFAWHELVQPGTALRTAWLAEVQALAAQLAALGHTDVAIVLDPLPQPGSATSWWGGQPGPDGNQALLRDLHAALAQAKVHSVLWAAEPMAGTPAPPPGSARPASLVDYSPGPLAFDLVLQIKPQGAPPRRDFSARMLHEFAGTRPVLLAPAF